MGGGVHDRATSRIVNGNRLGGRLSINDRVLTVKKLLVLPESATLKALVMGGPERSCRQSLDRWDQLFRAVLMAFFLAVVQSTEVWLEELVLPRPWNQQ